MRALFITFIIWNSAEPFWLAIVIAVLLLLMRERAKEAAQAATVRAIERQERYGLAGHRRGLL